MLPNVKQTFTMKSMDTNETPTTKIATSIRLELDLHNAIAILADKEDRPSQANMIERLLKTHPQIQPLLETESAAAA